MFRHFPDLSSFYLETYTINLRQRNDSIMKGLASLVKRKLLIDENISEEFLYSYEEYYM